MEISKVFYRALLLSYPEVEDKQLIEELHNLIHDQTSSSVEIFEKFGCYRHFGHPTVDETGGCIKMKEHTRAETKINDKIVTKVTGAWVKHTIQNFIARHGRWPSCSFALPEDHVLNKMTQHNLKLFDEFSITISFDEWSTVIFDKEFEFDYFPDFTTLLSDKALSPYLENWARVYCRDMCGVAYKSPMTESRRLLIQILKTRSFCLQKIMNQIQRRDIPENWYTIALHAKERELKIMARMFAMLVLEMRMYFCATEANIASKIFPYNTCQTMTLSESELFYHIQHVTGMTNDSNYIYVCLSIDYVKWNNMWRDKSTRAIFQKIDQLFGTPGLLSFTHEFFK